MKKRRGALAAVLLLPLMVPAVTGAQIHTEKHTWPVPDSLLARVREVTRPFLDVNYAMAMGYEPGPCVSGANGGAMGIHFVNGDLVDDKQPDVTQPEALIYEPQPGGALRLVGVEYITFASPAMLEGHLLNFNGAPNRYGLPAFSEIHVWAWRPNPNGTYADWNPRVSCDAFVAPPA